MEQKPKKFPVLKCACCVLAVLLAICFVYATILQKREAKMIDGIQTEYASFVGRLGDLSQQPDPIPFQDLADLYARSRVICTDLSMIFDMDIPFRRISPGGYDMRAVYLGWAHVEVYLLESMEAAWESGAMPRDLPGNLGLLYEQIREESDLGRAAILMEENCPFLGPS